MGVEIQKAGSRIAGSVVRSPVAMVLSYDSRFAFEIQPNNPLFSYAGHFQQVYRAFFERHISVDILSPNVDLSSYRVVVAPALHLLTDDCAENLKGFVKAGGTLLVTQRSGVKDETNTIVEQRLPGLLAEVCGVGVEEYDSLSSSMQNTLEYVLPELSTQAPSPVGVLCEILQPTTAAIVARYTGEFYAGKPAVTANSYGKGLAIYVGAVGNQSLYGTLVDWLLPKSGIKPVLSGSDGLEVTERWQGDRRLLFILNHGHSRQKINLDKDYTNLLDGHACSGAAVIEPRDVLILAET